MKISKKKSNELYKSVSDDIMDARVSVIKVLNKSVFRDVREQVDAILYRLSIDAPGNAISLFETAPTKKNN